MPTTSRVTGTVSDLDHVVTTAPITAALCAPAGLRLTSVVDTPTPA